MENERPVVLWGLELRLTEPVSFDGFSPSSRIGSRNSGGVLCHITLVLVHFNPLISTSSYFTSHG